MNKTKIKNPQVQLYNTSPILSPIWKCIVKNRRHGGNSNIPSTSPTSIANYLHHRAICTVSVHIGRTV